MSATECCLKFENLQDAAGAMIREDEDWLVRNGWVRELNGSKAMTEKFCRWAGVSPNGSVWAVVLFSIISGKDRQ